MTINLCKICNKIIKANKGKSVYCSNACKQKNYLENNKLKRSAQVPTEKQIFLHNQEVEGWKGLSASVEVMKIELDELAAKRLKQKEDDIFIKCQKDFERQIRINKEKEKAKILAEMLLNYFKKI